MVEEEEEESKGENYGKDEDTGNDMGNLQEGSSEEIEEQIDEQNEDLQRWGFGFSQVGFFFIEKDCLMCTGNQFFYFIAPRRHQWLFQSPKQGILWIFFRKEHNFHLVLSGFVSLI